MKRSVRVCASVRSRVDWSCGKANIVICCYTRNDYESWSECTSSSPQNGSSNPTAFKQTTQAQENRMTFACEFVAFELVVICCDDAGMSFLGRP
jgi:hypothetical protein